MKLFQRVAEVLLVLICTPLHERTLSSLDRSHELEAVLRRRFESRHLVQEENCCIQSIPVKLVELDLVWKTLKEHR